MYEMILNDQVHIPNEMVVKERAQTPVASHIHTTETEGKDYLQWDRVRETPPLVG